MWSTNKNIQNKNAWKLIFKTFLPWSIYKTQDLDESWQLFFILSIPRQNVLNVLQPSHPAASAVLLPLPLSSFITGTTSCCRIEDYHIFAFGFSSSDLSSIIILTVIPLLLWAFETVLTDFFDDFSGVYLFRFSVSFWWTWFILCFN